jgi:alpha-mannosidase
MSRVSSLYYIFNNIYFSPILVPKSFTLEHSDFFELSDHNVVLDTVKVAENPREGSKADLVVRLYESYGGRGTVEIKT